MIFADVFICSLLLGVGVFFIFFIDSIFGGLDFASNQSAVGRIVAIVKQRNLQNGFFYDLGSAHGGSATQIAQALPLSKVLGVDDNYLRFAFSTARSIWIKNVRFKKRNLFSTDVSFADVVYVYLPQELMPSLELKLQTELKSGALVITNKVSFPGWVPVEKLEELTIYAKK